MNKNTNDYKRELALSIGLKVNQLQREGLDNLDIKQFVLYLYNYKWKNHQPETISDAIIDVMSTNANTMVAYLSTTAIVEAKSQSLGDFDDLLR